MVKKKTIACSFIQRAHPLQSSTLLFNKKSIGSYSIQGTQPFPSSMLLLLHFPIDSTGLLNGCSTAVETHHFILHLYLGFGEFFSFFSSLWFLHEFYDQLQRPVK